MKCRNYDYLLKHGHSPWKGPHTPEYMIWHSMKRRCQSPKDRAYHHYGGRGIKVSEEWQTFANFIRDMGQRPSPDHSLDRINNNGPYCKENCAWTLRVDQMNNTRRNRYIEYQGRTLTMAQWGRELGIEGKLIGQRLGYGWSIEDALTKPKRRQSNSRTD
jgi:hypothetical protein